MPNTPARLGKGVTVWYASPETTASYVHLSTEHVAAEYAAARAVMGR